MNTVYLINNKPEEPSFAPSFADGANERGYETAELSISDLSFLSSPESDHIQIYNRADELKVSENDLFFIRARKPQASATALLCFVLESCGYSFNERETSLEHNIRGSKMAQSFIFKQHNIDFPKTLVTTLSNYQRVEKIVNNHFSFPLVVKQTGSKGEKVWKCENESELHRLLSIDLGEDTEKLIMFQEYIPNNFDIRVIVNYGKIVASISRSSNDGFYNNVSQGGDAEAIELTQEEQDIALRAANVTRLELAGIDIVRSENGPLLFEVNKAPDITAFSNAAGVDLATQIAETFIDVTLN